MLYVVQFIFQEPAGAFRATFEDKILMKDIVFLRSWFTVPIPKFYTPVHSLLLPPGDKTGGWTGMRTVGTLRFERGLKPPVESDSVYKPIERRPFMSDPLVVPKNLEKKLPYEFKTKNMDTILPENGDEDLDRPSTSRKHAHKATRPTDDTDSPLIQKHSAVILEPHETKIRQVMEMLKTVSADAAEKRAQEQTEKARKYAKVVAKRDAKRAQYERVNKKRICKRLGQAEIRKTKAIQGKGRRR